MYSSNEILIPRIMSQRVVISGSWAYDYLMDFDGLYKEVLLPEKIDHLSVAFLASKKTTHFGGCAGNIAYTLNLFGIQPVLAGLVGKDFDQYEKWLHKQGLNSSTLTKVPEDFTAAAYILTDREHNQMVIFHAGAMVADVEGLKITEVAGEADWVIISPDDPRRMVRLAKECVELGMKYIFDPSQQISSMKVEDLREAVKGATVLMVNEYEADLLASKFGITVEELAAIVPVFVETLGEKGVRILANKSENSTKMEIVVPGLKPEFLANPTGCGDAFRAGFLFGLHKSQNENSDKAENFDREKSERKSDKGLDLFNPEILKKAAQIGVLAATYTLEKAGTQEHKFTLQEFADRFGKSFGAKFNKTKNI